MDLAPYKFYILGALLLAGIAYYEIKDVPEEK